MTEETIFVILCYAHVKPFAWEAHEHRQDAIKRQLELQAMNPQSTFEIVKTKLVHDEVDRPGRV